MAPEIAKPFAGTHAKDGKRWRQFLILLAGQTASATGSYLVSFTLRCWVFETTRSVTTYSGLALLTDIPGLVVAPLAGYAADKWSRKAVIALSDVAAALTSVWLLMKILPGSGTEGEREEGGGMGMNMGDLEVQHVYLAIAVNGLFTAVQYPAFQASVTALTTARTRGRASGLVDLGGGIAELLAPVTAGVIAASFGSTSVVVVDLLTCTFAVVTVLAARIPHCQSMPTMAEKPLESVRAVDGDSKGKASGKDGECLDSGERTIFKGWQWSAAVRRQTSELGAGAALALSDSSLRRLLCLSCCRRFVLAFIVQLIPPMVLSLAGQATLGVVSSVSGAGLLVGSVAVSVWGTPDTSKAFTWIIVLMALQGCIMQAAWGMLDPTVIGVTGFLFLGMAPLINACDSVLWREKLAKKNAIEVCGRAYAFQGQCNKAAWLLGVFLTGPLTDDILEPWMSAGGRLHSTVVGQALGAGQPGRGACFLFLLLGVFSATSALVGWISLLALPPPSTTQGEQGQQPHGKGGGVVTFEASSVADGMVPSQGYRGHKFGKGD